MIDILSIFPAVPVLVLLPFMLMLTQRVKQLMFPTNMKHVELFTDRSNNLKMSLVILSIYGSSGCGPDRKNGLVEEPLWLDQNSEPYIRVEPIVVPAHRRSGT